MKKSFGEFIRELREKEGMPLRKVAAFVDIDASTLSKIERGERNANKEIIPLLSQILNISENKLLLTLLSDTVAESLIYENNSSEILKVAEEKIKYLKSKNFQQGNLKFD
ncbi:helix-turn-helix domain-containing protein [Epilithonimonas hispanica]|uniref:Transcriptional regulator n=1 Tax=Epilithonimonas hispanica TaxID=358687 RepID=A0A3D9CMN8_9FLAO|nr:helix-turn-helix transcriptional regulator [Epilithonimonas hispanica]REC67005.1 transcriptional regulator [Epilithonimonas hispanica]